MLLVCPLCHADSRDGILGGEHVPGTISPKNQTTMFVDIHRVDPDIRFRTDHKHIFLAIVGPKVTERSGDSKEGNFIDVRGSTDRTLVSHLGTVPDDSGHPGFADHFAPTLGDPLTLLWNKRVRELTLMCRG